MGAGRRHPFVPVLLAAATLSSCQTNEVKVPDLSGPSSPVGTVPVNVVVAPPIESKPSPTPAPTSSTPPPPPSTPSPTPPPSAPNPTPAPPSSGSCKLPPGVGDSAECDRTSASFLDDVEAALDQITQDQPQLFDKTDTKCSNCY